MKLVRFAVRFVRTFWFVLTCLVLWPFRKHRERAQTAALAAQETCPVTEYLLGNGWLPAPTINAASAWWHPELCKVPKALTKGCGIVWSPGEIRMEKSAAFMVQLVHERQREDAFYEQFSIMSMLVEVSRVHQRLAARGKS